MGRFTPPPVLMACCAAIMLPRCFAAGPPEIPFRLDNGFITLHARIEGSARLLNVLLDSGASESVLSDRTAARLGLARGHVERIRGVANETTAYVLDGVRAISNSVDLGDVRLAADLSATDQLCREPIDALIGAPFFRGRIIEIDFAAHCIRLLDELAKHSNDACIPLKVQNGVLCAPTSVNGCRARWIRLDTGCNEPLHWVIGRDAARSRVIARSIGFVSRQEDLAVVSVSLGGHVFPETEAVLHNRPLFPSESGLLGMGLLSQFATVTIDWRGQVLLLKKR